MNVLWVTPQLPCRRSGGQVRQYHLLKHLCQRHQVVVLSLVREGEYEGIPALEALGCEVVAEPFAPPMPLGLWRNRVRSWVQLLSSVRPHYACVYPLEGLGERLRSILNQRQVDIVHFEHLFVAPLGSMVGDLPWVMTEQNIESRNTESQARQATAPTRRLAGWLEVQKLRRWERMWVRRSTACVAVSEVDAAELRAVAPSKPIFVIPNGVDTNAFTPPRGTEVRRAGLLFFGTLGYFPNADAVMYFCREIFPHVRERHPDVTLSIIGAHAPPEVVSLGDLPGVQYVGFVTDVRPYLWRAAACVVPLRSGGGTRLKILESLAAGCPVVSTTIGVEGLALRGGQDIVVADDPIAFAEVVSDLLSDAGRRQRLADQGRRVVRDRYDWSVIGPQLEVVLDSVVRAHE